MTSAFRLEDFSALPPPKAPSYTSSDLDAAYERGRSDAETGAMAEAVKDLAASLSAASEAVEALRSNQQDTVQEVLSSVRPILHAVIDQLLPQRDELLSIKLCDELAALCRAGVEPVCHIAGSIELTSLVADKVEEMGIEGITIQPGDTTSIHFEGGHISFDPDAAIIRIENIIKELDQPQEGTSE